MLLSHALLLGFVPLTTLASPAVAPVHYTDVLLQEALSRTDDGKLFEAIEILEGLVAVDKSLVEPKFALAKLYFELGWWEDAAALLLDVTAANPGHQAAWLMLGKANERLCNWQQAREAYQHVQDNSPTARRRLRALTERFGAAQIWKPERVEKLKVAAGLMNSKMGDVDANLATIERCCRGAAAQGVRLILFGEEFITGSLNKGFGDEGRELAEPVPGPVTERLHDIARRFQITIVSGIVERRDDGRLYNTCVVVAPSGYLGRFSKVHLPSGETQYFAPGNEVPVFDAAGTRFCVGICYDLRFADLFAVAALRGAKLFLLAVAGSGGPDQYRSPEGLRKHAQFHADLWKTVLPARACDNGMWILATDQFGVSGSDWFGSCAMVLDPDGRVVAEQIGQEGLLVYELDLTRVGIGRTVDKRRLDVYGSPLFRRQM